jgi:hypothetical protein
VWIKLSSRLQINSSTSAFRVELRWRLSGDLKKDAEVSGGGVEGYVEVEANALLTPHA